MLGLDAPLLSETGAHTLPVQVHDILNRALCSGQPASFTQEPRVEARSHTALRFTYESGVTRQLGNGYSASGGYFFSENSTPDRDYNPIIADGNLHVVAFGVGRKGERFSWAAACELIGGPWNNVENTVDPTVAGKYRLFTPTLSGSIGCHF